MKLLTSNQVSALLPSGSGLTALVAHQENGRWTVDALGAPHIGERSEKALISSFVDRIAKSSPQLVTFNGSSFDRRLQTLSQLLDVLSLDAAIDVA